MGSPYKTKSILDASFPQSALSPSLRYRSSTKMNPNVSLTTFPASASKHLQWAAHHHRHRYLDRRPTFWRNQYRMPGERIIEAMRPGFVQYTLYPRAKLFFLFILSPHLSTCHWFFFAPTAAAVDFILLFLLLLLVLLSFLPSNAISEKGKLLYQVKRSNFALLYRFSDGLKGS